MVVHAIVEGEEPGDTCNRDGCRGEITEAVNPWDGCSCHCGNPPCSYCTFQAIECDECGWEDERSV